MCSVNAGEMLKFSPKLTLPACCKSSYIMPEIDFSSSPSVVKVFWQPLLRACAASAAITPANHSVWRMLLTGCSLEQQVVTSYILTLFIFTFESNSFMHWVIYVLYLCCIIFCYPIPYSLHSFGRDLCSVYILGSRCAGKYCICQGLKSLPLDSLVPAVEYT